MFNTVPNQKIITIKKNSKEFLLKKDNVKLAMKNLKPSAFKIWLYFMSYQDGNTFALYKKDVCDFCNIKERSYHSGIQELIETKYLIPIRENTNHYIFIDLIEDNSKNISFNDYNYNDYNYPYYIYKYVDKNENIVYIGKTINIKQRVLQHKNDKLKNFIGKVFYFNCKNKNDMDALEFVLINKYHPILNEELKDENLKIDLKEPEWILYEIIEK